MFSRPAPNRNLNARFPGKQKNKQLAFNILIAELFSIYRIVQQEQGNLNTLYI